MTTKKAGGKITGTIALTCEAQYAAAVGDYVHIVGPYEVALADGTKPIIGHVSVKNVKRGGASAFTAQTPGDVTVEARGWNVKTHKSAGALAAGIEVGIDASGDLVAVGAGVAKVGITLTAATAANQDVDVLSQ
jgi:hypothetical protein